MPHTKPYDKAFKDGAVELLRTSGKSVSQVARDLGIGDDSLHRWTVQTEIEAGTRQGLTEAEKEEVRKLKREIAILTKEREILKNAVTFFVQETNPAR